MMRWGLFIFIYWVGVYAGVTFTVKSNDVSIIWPASGVALAFYLLTKRQKWAALTAVVFGVTLSVHLLEGQLFYISFGLALADTLEAFMGAWLMTRICGDAVAFMRPKEIIVLFWTSIFVSVITTMIEAGVLPASAHETFFANWLTWWLADGTGVLLLTPLIVTWATKPIQLNRSSVERFLESIVIVLFLSALVWGVFGAELFSRYELIQAFLITPVLIWSAFRFSPRGTATILFVFALLTIWSTLLGYGEFAIKGNSTAEAILVVESVFGMMSVTSLLMATFITDRKLQTESLKESEARFRALFEQSHDAVFILDLQGRHIAANQRAANMLGYTPTELLKLSVKETSAETEESDQVIQRLLAGEQIPLYERFFRKKNGEIIPTEINVELVRDGEGRPLHVQSVVRDITKRKRAQNEILEKSKELEALFKISSHLRTAQSASDMLPLVLSQISQVLKADANAVILLDPAQNHFVYAIGNGLLASNTGLIFSVENSMSGRIMQTRQPYVTLDFSNDPLRSLEIQKNELIGSTVLVPLQSETEFIGTLLCARAKDSQMGLFTPVEVQLLVAIGEMVGNALRRARLYDDALARLQRVQALRSIDAAINANMDLNITLNILINHTLALLNVDAAVAFIFNSNTHMLEYAASEGFRNNEIKNACFGLNNEYAGTAVMERRIIPVPDISDIQDPDYKEMVRREQFVSCYVTPMIAKGQVRGVLEVYSRSPLAANEEWVDFLKALGVQAAIAIDNFQLFTDLQTSNLELSFAYDATIEGWSHALDLKDKETEGHTLRVTEWTLGLAKLAGLGENEIMHIRRGALLHDIGKMGIPDHILNKIGKLTQKEWDIMRQHPQLAYNMLHPIQFLHPALDIPYCHHEKWDGTGYPNGLKGTQIPYAARLFSVVDVWDALTHQRVYRKAWSKKKTLAYIQEQSGQYFDPQAVDLFLKFIETLDAHQDEG